MQLHKIKMQSQNVPLRSTRLSGVPIDPREIRVTVAVPRGKQRN